MIKWPHIGIWGDFEPCEEGILEKINYNFILLDALVQGSIINFVASLPLTPADGDTYVLNDVDVIYYDGTDWLEFPVQEGYRFWVESLNQFYYYDGTDWILWIDAVTSVNGQTGVVLLDTDDIPEGTTNLYFTDARARAAALPMPANTIKGNNTGASGPALDLTVTQTTAMLNNFVGDSGAGGLKGLVPAPASGDAVAQKYLNADGTWKVPAGGGGAGSLAPFINQDYPSPQNKLIGGVNCYEFIVSEDSAFDLENRQSIWYQVDVSSSYVAGNPIALTGGYFAVNTTNNALNVKMKTNSWLIKPTTVLNTVLSAGVSYPSTNAQVLASTTAYQPRPIGILDLTSGSGTINSVAVAPGDTILVQLYRDHENETSSVTVPAYLIKDKFQLTLR